jgi:DNA-binding winged helix-turn-helix (wHTH) protein
MEMHFGEFVLDPERRTLLSNGEERHLSKKAFDLLEILVGSAPNAKTKQELYRTLWGDTIVEEANLPNLVSEIRAALGESARSNRFIRTVHGYGYSFAGAIARQWPAAEPGARSQQVCSLLWNRVELPLVAGRNTIGRGAEADVTIDAGSVSRLHACVTVAGGRVAIEDLGSKNGTQVRGERISGAVELRDGDELRIGAIDVVFRATGRQSSTLSCLAD